jgi:hypothetical protein
VYARDEKRSSTGAPEAQETAVAALAWFAEDSERLQRFLAVSGLGPQNLRSAAADPGFFSAILDYLATDESLLIAFATHINLTPEFVMQARFRLGGREQQNDP